MATQITAPMVGKVISVLVEVGQQVAEDEPLLMLEAMKVEMPIASPANGTVASIQVKEGDTVEAESLLMELD
jgi:biotin carboxyl carrier protein